MRKDGESPRLRMRSGQERRSKPPRVHHPSSRPPPALSSRPSLGSGDGAVRDALSALEEHSFRLPLTLPSERHVKSILQPPPTAPAFEIPQDVAPPSFEVPQDIALPDVEPQELAPHELAPQELAPREAPLQEALEDDADDELREGERLQRARQASMQRWAILVTAPLAIVAIAAVVRAAVIWGRTSTTSVNAANVATATATVNASPPLAPPPPRAPEPEPPTPKAAPAPAAPIIVTPEEQVARDRAAAKKEKFEAQAALEVGDGRRAQRAAKHATTLDPSDAQGWLLLVAAELDCKNPVAANEALRSCLERATRGPRGECIGMVVGRAARAKKTMDVKTLSTLEPPDMPPPTRNVPR